LKYALIILLILLSTFVMAADEGLAQKGLIIEEDLEREQGPSLPSIILLIVVAYTIFKYGTHPILKK